MPINTLYLLAMHKNDKDFFSILLQHLPFVLLMEHCKVMVLAHSIKHHYLYCIITLYPLLH